MVWEGSVYPKGRKWWVWYKPLGSDAWAGAPTPFYRDAPGDREKAEALLRTMREKWVAHRRASAGEAGPITVRRWCETWIAKRQKEGIDSAAQEATHLRMHVYPILGDMLLVDVRRVHALALLEALKEKPRKPRSPTEAPERLAPRTVLHVIRTTRQCFKAAMRAELIASNPIDFERRELPKKEDKDPAWRADAVFTVAEVEALISDPRIPEDRRVLYAAEFLTGTRPGEAAALRWDRWDRSRKPLGQVTLIRSYSTPRRVEKGTKTKRPRLVPVHPILAQLLAQWKLAGWQRVFGRAPREDDLVFPQANPRPGYKLRPEHHRSSSSSLRCFRRDLTLLGLRQRRHYDSRRTFRSIAGSNGASKELVQWITHTPGDQVDDYFSPSWEALCGAVLCIPVKLRARGTVSRIRAR